MQLRAQEFVYGFWLSACMQLHGIAQWIVHERTVAVDEKQQHQSTANVNSRQNETSKAKQYELLSVAAM
jgi:hypothetical protein